MSEPQPIDAATRIHLAGEIEAIARAAGEVILTLYAEGTESWQKADHSPVTKADLAANSLIVSRLRALTPQIPIVAEEDVADGGTAPDVAAGRFWLVDPLDGTKEFLNRNGEFTVNIALIDRGHPILGVVYTPAQGLLHLGLPARDGESRVQGDGPPPCGAWRVDDDGNREPISCRRPPVEGLTAVVSRSHPSPEVEDYLARHSVAERCSKGSSLKFCILAEGAADLYPRMGPTMEWDTAAGHAVLIAAGGTVETLDGQPLTYGKPDFRNPHFIARGLPTDS